MLNQLSRGRPAININANEVQHLVKCGFTWTFIANRIGCSYKTIQRWCRINNFHRPNNSDFTNEEIDYIVSNLLINHPNVGLIYTWSYITADTHLDLLLIELVKVF